MLRITALPEGQWFHVAASAGFAVKIAARSHSAVTTQSRLVAGGRMASRRGRGRNVKGGKGGKNGVEERERERGGKEEEDDGSGDWEKRSRKRKEKGKNGGN